MFTRFYRDFEDPYESGLYRNPSNYGLLPRLLLDDYLPNPTPHLHLSVIRPRRQTNVELKNKAGGDSNQFQVMLNVKHFRPDEIDVKTVDNFVVIRGKHEEHADEHGFVSREFTRRYQIPDDVEPNTVTSSLSQDGVLTIRGPRKQLEPPPKNERIVPIIIEQPAAVEEVQKQQAAAAEQQKMEE